MNEFNIKIEEFSPQKKDRIKLLITIENEGNEELLYKVLIGHNGKWSLIRDYSLENKVIWEGDLKGHYMVMVQAKEKYSNKPFDYTERIEYVIGQEQNKEIERDLEITSFACLNEKKITGEYITFEVATIQKPFRSVLYKFIKISEDGDMEIIRDYFEDNYLSYIEKLPGKYKLLAIVKYSDSDREFDDRAVVSYEVKPCDKVFIHNFTKFNKETNEVEEIENLYNSGVIGSEERYRDIANKPTYLRDKLLLIEAQYGEGIEEFSFLVKKDGKVIHSDRNILRNYIYFTPNENGNYVIETRVKDNRSEECVEGIAEFRVLDYRPASIEYVLKSASSGYIVGKNICFETITDRNNETLCKYKVFIDGNFVEEVEYDYNKQFVFVPRCAGKYSFHFLVKNEMSTAEYDGLKVVQLFVQEEVNIENIRIVCDKETIVEGDPVTFFAECDGEASPLYEFYMMTKGEWRKVQGYSRKNYYTFIPFKADVYRFLMLCKNPKSDNEYDAFSQCEFKVEKYREVCV